MPKPDIRTGVRYGLIALGTIFYLYVLGLPLTFGSAATGIFAVVTALIAFLVLRGQADTPGSTAGILVNGLLIGLIAGAGIGLVTLYTARLHANLVQVQTVFAQLLPAHTAAVTGISREAIVAGESVTGGVIRLALILTGGGVLGGVLSLIMTDSLSQRRQQLLASQTGHRLILALPLFIYGSFLLVRQDIISLSVNRQNIWGLVIVFMFMAASLVSMRQAHTKVENRIVTAMVLILIVLLPRLTDMFQNAVLSKVFIFAAVGIGLNIVIGYAGMLHLGFAAFFAVGAYSFGLLTSPSSYFVQNPEGLAWLESFDALGFWSALLIAIIISTIIGLLLGLPILRTRGDYLAIVTLGFSEIIRLLFLNLRDHTGGPGGILNIPSAELFDINLGTTMGVVYMGMVLTGVVIFISMRLRQSRLGRAWMAMREDEDVAQMMGVNPANMKLLAFAIGSAFAGAAGVLYTSRQVNIFPDNFDLQTSIDILSLIIIGGLGSIEGVVLGAIALVGLPEVLRGVDEYRIVAFGALLVIMMIVRPEGLMPSAQRQLELHQEDLSQDAWLEMAGVEAEANDEDAPDQENQSEDMN